ncbi:MAG TPA: hypothetical protein VGT81_18915 [Casimicrobiaceae bacterium]|nr:hypothetical protein [Casimicrobiaceae bacterium]
MKIADPSRNRQISALSRLVRDRQHTQPVTNEATDADFMERTPKSFFIVMPLSTNPYHSSNKHYARGRDHRYYSNHGANV